MSTEVLIVPGLGGSGAEHWQTRWESLHPEYRRVQMPDWDAPRLDEWIAELELSVQRAPSPPVVVAHSLGCLAVAHWAVRGGRLRGALLVAVPDPDGPAFPSVARSFAPAPLAPLGFPSRLVASHDDPYGSFAFAARCAAAWGSQLCDVGDRGHINADSALGDWPEGEQLLRGLLI